MSTIRRLASSLGRKDEEPNVVLAREIAGESDAESVQELVGLLHSTKKDVRSDCIKVLYEVGAIQPSLISEYVEAFAALLSDTNNRLVWGAMTALDAIASAEPEPIYRKLPEILAAAERGSVIAKDHAVGILIKLCANEAYAAEAFPMLLAQLRTCPTNQLPMYAENALPLIHTGNKEAFNATLLDRLIEIEKDSKRKRVEKAIRAAEKR